MIGIIISGHGSFASGIISSLELIAGKQENVVAVDFTINDSFETLYEKLKIQLKELDDCEEVLFLTDIAGGTPFRVCANLSYELNNSTVVGGTNLGMLLEISLCGEDVELEQLKNMAIESGRKAVKALEITARKQTSSNGI